MIGNDKFTPTFSYRAFILTGIVAGDFSLSNCFRYSIISSPAHPVDQAIET
jgi:hypothetical protein